MNHHLALIMVANIEHCRPMPLRSGRQHREGLPLSLKQHHKGVTHTLIIGHLWFRLDKTVFVNHHTTSLCAHMMLQMFAGKSLTLIGHADSLLPRMPARCGAHAKKWLEGHGAKVQLASGPSLRFQSAGQHHLGKPPTHCV